MKPISQQVEEIQQALDAKSQELSELVTKSVEADEQAEHEDAQDALADEVKSLTRKLDRLKALEGAEAGRGLSAVNGSNGRKAAESRGSISGSRIEVVNKEYPKGTLFTRYAMSIAAGKGSISDTLAHAKRWTDTPEVAAYVKAEAGTAVVQSPGWGGELVPDRTLVSEFVDLVRAQTVLDKLQGIRRVPPRVSIQVQTSGSTFEWVGEAGVKPVGELAFTTVAIGDHKVAGIVVITEELVRLSTPSAEETVRRDLIAQCARYIDTQFLTTTVTAGANNPASITASVASPPASGTDADALYFDMNAALATFDNADLGTNNVYIVTTPALARGISTLRNALGQFEFSGVNMMGGTLMGLPVIVSSAVQSGHIILIKADEIFLSDEGRVRLDASNQATLSMTGEATATFSLWQRNCIGLRAEQFITWAKRRADSVAIIDTAAYGPTSGS
jgi:HK97 family phage major capsid protein